MLPIDWDGNGRLDVWDLVTGAGLEAGARGSGEPTAPGSGGRGGCAGPVSCFFMCASFMFAFVAELLA